VPASGGITQARLRLGYEPVKKLFAGGGGAGGGGAHRRARRNSCRVKRPGDHGTRHSGPATIKLDGLHLPALAA
jgi:hypothetical protein